jgi:magnesium transporter
MDFVVNQYFPILEAFEGQVVELEEVILGEKFIQETTSRIYNLKRELLSIKRAVWPLGDVFVTLPDAISQPMSAVTPPILN